MLPRATERDVLIMPNGLEGETVGIDRYKAIVDERAPEHVYAVASDIYKIVQHEEGLRLLEQSITDNPEFGHFTRDLQVCDGGGFLKATYTFTEAQVEIRKGDFVHPQLVAFNSYNMRSVFAVILGAWRQVCRNGAYIGIKSYVISRRHTTGLSIEDASVNIKDAMHDFSIKTEIWKRWAEQECTFAEYHQVMSGMSGMTEKEYSDVNREFDEYNVLSVWTFFNILTAYATHRVTFARQHALSRAIAKAFQGV